MKKSSETWINNNKKRYQCDGSIRKKLRISDKILTIVKNILFISHYWITTNLSYILNNVYAKYTFERGKIFHRPVYRRIYSPFNALSRKRTCLRTCVPRREEKKKMKWGKKKKKQNTRPSWSESEEEREKSAPSSFQRLPPAWFSPPPSPCNKGGGLGWWRGRVTREMKRVPLFDPQTL